MATDVEFFWDGINWCDAEAVFTNSLMTTYAPLGWYEYNGYKRYFDGAGALSNCISCY